MSECKLKVNEFKSLWGVRSNYLYSYTDSLHKFGQNYQKSPIFNHIVNIVQCGEDKVIRNIQNPGTK